MRQPTYTRTFERDLKRMLRRGKDPAKIKFVLAGLIEGVILDSRFRDHKLAGPFIGRRECHVEPDWLLIYKLLEEELVFERTGSHADLYE